MIIGLCSMLLRFYATYWIYNDTKKMGLESSKRFMWTVGTLFVWYLAVPLYFILVRNSRTVPSRRQEPADNVTYSEPKGEAVDVSEKVTCPMCKKPVPSSFSFCPHCGYTMKPQCSGCGKTLEPEWATCPHCGTKVGEDETGDEIKPETKEEASTTEHE